MLLFNSVVFLIAGTLSFTIAQGEDIPSTDSVAQGTSNSNTTSRIVTDEYERLLRDKCTKNGGPNAYDTLKAAPAHFATCVQSLVNVTVVKAEIAEARPRGDLDVVFNKYCQKVPNFKTCVRNGTDAIEPCLETAEERNAIKISHNITSSLLAFMCYNEGDRIAMFVAAGGIECFKSKRKAVEACANQTSMSFPAMTFGRTDGGHPSFALGLSECTYIESFQTCAVNALEECDDPTPANVVDSLINFVKRVTPCQNLLRARASANGRK